MTRRTANHVVVRTIPPQFVAQCRHCGGQCQIALPCHLDLLVGLLSTFLDVHKACAERLGVGG